MDVRDRKNTPHREIAQKTPKSGQTSSISEQTEMHHVTQYYYKEKTSLQPPTPSKHFKANNEIKRWQEQRGKEEVHVPAQERCSPGT